MKRSKKRAGTKPAKTITYRIPKGFPGAGRITTRETAEHYTLLLKEQAREAARQAKLARDREKRQLARTARAALMVKPDAVTTRSELSGEIAGWGSTSTSRLREGTTYAWHGAFRITGGVDHLRQLAAAVGSSRKSPTQNSDGTYSIVLTPFLGFYTPAAAVDAVPDAANSYNEREFAGLGNAVTYLGAFYNPHRDDE